MQDIIRWADTKHWKIQKLNTGYCNMSRYNTLKIPNSDAGYYDMSRQPTTHRKLDKSNTRFTTP